MNDWIRTRDAHGEVEPISIERDFPVKVLHEEMRFRQRKQLHLLANTLQRQSPVLIPHHQLEIIVSIVPDIVVINAPINFNHIP
jgi:hypothetical protein